MLYFSIDTYLAECIESEPHKPVFNESFTFRDLYVPLKAQPLNAYGEPDSHQPVVVLEEWAKALLNDDRRKDQVLFIQGEPGRGKSVFCRLFADWVRQYEHPRWTPILIRLRDVVLEKDFEETLRKAVDRDFAETDPGWLYDRNTRFLFLLDGFDELLMQGRTSGGLEELLRQVSKFQESCARNSEKGHRILITGRTLSLLNIERLMATIKNLERVKILPLDPALQQEWFVKWGQLVGADKALALQTFLQSDDCPERLRGNLNETGLAQEPLLLYLLAAMHRDNELDITMFTGVEGAKAKILIYQRTLDWVLTKQRPEWLQRQVTELEREGLRRILMEAGLSVVQAGGECAPITMIESRLTDAKAKDLLAEARQRLGENPLRNALAAFYLQPGKGEAGSVEFAHKSFGEFLCAERIAQALEDWSYPGRRSEFEVSTEQMDWEIYDLLGSPVLTPEIVDYLMVLLAESTAFRLTRTSTSEYRLITLFNRLHNFYQRWCRGEYIDALMENLPQKKLHLLQEQLQSQQNQLGLRQIDVYAGLNVMILLLRLQNYAQAKSSVQDTVTFHLCGQPGTNAFDEMRLLQIIGYSECVKVGAFRAIVAPFLSGANLSKANLSHVNLSGANLNHADLSNTDLTNVDFNDTNLDHANLNSANLDSANLVSANCFNADFRSANLRGTNLVQACFNGAKLHEANLNGANLRTASLHKTNLCRANLRGADLTSAKLPNADLSRAVLVSTTLVSADLSSATLDNAEFQNANLRRANLSYASLRSANLRSADLRSANVSFANLAGITWEQSQWSGIQGLLQANNLPKGLMK